MTNGNVCRAVVVIAASTKAATDSGVCATSRMSRCPVPLSIRRSNRPGMRSEDSVSEISLSARSMPPTAISTALSAAPILLRLCFPGSEAVLKPTVFTLEMEIDCLQLVNGLPLEIFAQK